MEWGNQTWSEWKELTELIEKELTENSNPWKSFKKDHWTYSSRGKTLKRYNDDGMDLKIPFFKSKLKKILWQRLSINYSEPTRSFYQLSVPIFLLCLKKWEEKLAWKEILLANTQLFLRFLKVKKKILNIFYSL